MSKTGSGASRLPKPNWVEPKRKGGYEDLPKFRVSPQRRKRHLSPTIVNSAYQTKELKEVNDILALYRRQELEHKVKLEYTGGSEEVKRVMLFDWLRNIAKSLRMMPYTLYLGYKIFDLYTSANPISETKILLVGVTCLFIAAKYEEIYPPLIEDLVYFNDTLSMKDIRRAEKIILNKLKWEFTYPSEYHFFGSYIAAMNTPYSKEMIEKEGREFLYNLVLNPNYISMLPSLKAAVALYLALIKVSKFESLSPDLIEQIEFFTQYPLSTIDAEARTLKLRP